MTVLILGGGIAGLSLAHFLKGKSVILEKEQEIGGLCRSFALNGVSYDVGPHILFSKNTEVLEFHKSLVKTNAIRRSNKIFHKGKLVKYPFENDLAALDEEERDYCLKEFLNNPYEDYVPQNMLQFFLKTFGEGITKLYLQPYNEKIWKLDPSCMDTQMVERIPKPPKEDILKSAQGIETEGYTHQLNFYYPQAGGMESLVQAYARLIQEKAEIKRGVAITRITKGEGGWTVLTEDRTYSGKTLVNCMPLQELFKLLDAPEEIRKAVDGLRYNSLCILAIQVKEDQIGNHFALTFADKDLLFHRVSKLNFLGEAYRLKGGGSTLLVEITFRPHSFLESLSQEKIREKVLRDLEKTGLIRREDVIAMEMRRFKYAYVVYDLNHRKNMDIILGYLNRLGIHSCGRFAEFLYINSDVVVERAKALAGRLEEHQDGQKS